ncbi:MAG: glycine cleavage system protein GcvH [Alphaproteobacteria bacterium]|jgi:glycine cleavage system H protein|nr:glycine cleavage system protein GcvH [Alphaproteobacteria bacterium]MBT4709993.1 glycine cleavage system protein GcvH [Alphaproteobacteria bacterium]MBT5860211.1 glycine cleavage system protein GcvH [Alphaproteobacteria bacterium]
MSDKHYTEDHEWVSMDGDIATVGISNYAQDQLGDVVFVELPDTGASLEKGAEVAVVESVKAASEVYAPVAGDVVEVNDAIGDNPSLVNEDAEGEGWFLKIKVAGAPDLSELMDASAYADEVAD